MRLSPSDGELIMIVFGRLFASLLIVAHVSFGRFYLVGKVVPF